MKERRVVGSFETFAQAHDAFEVLVHRGYGQSNMAIVSPTVHGEKEILGFTPRSSVAASGAFHGALWGAALGVLVAFLIMLTVPAVRGFWLNALMTFLFGFSLGGLAGIVIGMLTSWSLAPDFIIAQDGESYAHRYALCLSATEETARKARHVLLEHERTLERSEPAATLRAG